MPMVYRENCLMVINPRLAGEGKTPTLFRGVIASKQRAAGVPNVQYLSQTTRSLRFYADEVSKISVQFFLDMVFFTSCFSFFDQERGSLKKKQRIKSHV